MFNTTTRPVALTFSLCAVVSGCADDERLPDDGGTICSEPDTSPCGDQEGNDEVGDGDGDGDGEDYKFCTASPGNGVRTVHQCNGHLDVSIDFRVGKKDCLDLLGDKCSETHHFGVGEEPYAMPAVMACCDAEGTPEDDALTYCTADLVEQVCRSITTRLEVMIKQGDVAGAENQATNLLWYLVTHRQDCFDALHKPAGPGAIGPVEWKIGNSKGWKLLEDFTVKLNMGVVDSASLPSDGSEPLACESDDWNDNEVFEERGPLSPVLGVDIHQLGDSANVSIRGPRLLDGGHVHGSAKAASQSVCAAPRCSSLALAEDDLGLVIDSLDIYADGSAEVAMGEMSFEVDQLALRLYGAVQARPYNGNDGISYTIAPGAAHFLVTGSIGGLNGMRWAENLDAIRVHGSDGSWTIEGFTVVHVDGRSGTWTAAIPMTTWD